MKHLDGLVSPLRLMIHGYKLWLGFFAVCLAMMHSVLDSDQLLNSDLFSTLSPYLPASFFSVFNAPLTGLTLLAMAVQEVFLPWLSMSTSMHVLPVSPVVEARRRGLRNLTYIAIPLPLVLLLWTFYGMPIPGFQFGISSVVCLLAYAATFLASPICSRLLLAPHNKSGSVYRVIGFALAVSLAALLLARLGGSLLMLSVIAVAGLGLFIWGGPVHVTHRAPVGLRSKRTGPLSLRPASSPQVAHFTRVGRTALWQILSITGGVAAIAVIPNVIGDAGLDLFMPFIVGTALFSVGGGTTQDVQPLPISTTTRAWISLGQRLTFGGLLLAVSHLLFGLSYPLVPVLGMLMLILTDAMLMEPAQVAASRNGRMSDNQTRLVRGLGFYSIAATLTWTMLPPPLANRPDHWHPVAEALYQQQLMPRIGPLQYVLLGIGTVLLALMAIRHRRSLRWAA